ncbi:N-acetylmuramic acid 6-phosphate etherase [Candidatus Uabimicrobium amorphum]|uniref:N-acetylmuramic acid 6-phosphate etherase n=1 Tax=Uabimicrobium amorphum TaxID=2596890 RepID=A0A5S9F5P2_UABAM|nr:N-acetylmuramic acid 6-phosphate etherase [Candidatus Uabimicrobium amorphum]BBM85774.1 N-acetylmuramic acid 6-phosphate etherase [Candidatus Uabimicrobium amorphum]
MQANEKLPETEQRLEASKNLHTMTISQITDLMIAEEYHVIAALKNCQKSLEDLIEQTVQCFTKGGRLFYVGAGTSGRLGVLDASECPPTFRAPHEMVQGIIAGGDVALQKAVEGAEDSEEQGGISITKRQITKDDIVVGIAASGRTPFVHGALKEAKQLGAHTGLVTCITLEKPSYVTHLVCAVVGAEILSGSTRLKAGTATKLILNMITTVSMVRLGKVYENLMVDLHASNAKLHKRAKRIFMQIVKNSDEDYARDTLEKANWEVKTAVVMALCNFSYKMAKEALHNNNNTLHLVLKNNG